MVAALRKRTGVDFDPHNEALIDRLMAAGEEDLRLVVWHRCRVWKDTEHAQHLRPSTLFGEKFPEYLAQARAEWGDRPLKIQSDEELAS